MFQLCDQAYLVLPRFTTWAHQATASPSPFQRRGRPHQRLPTCDVLDRQVSGCFPTLTVLAAVVVILLYFVLTSPGHPNLPTSLCTLLGALRAAKREEGNVADTSVRSKNRRTVVHIIPCAALFLMTVLSRAYAQIDIPVDLGSNLEDDSPNQSVIVTTTQTVPAGASIIVLATARTVLGMPMTSATCTDSSSHSYSTDV